MGEAAKGIPDESEVETPEKTRGPLLKCLLLVAVLLGLSIAWRWTPISEWINFRTIVEWQNSVRAHPAALLFVIGTYLAGSLVLFPVTILNVATVFTFGPIRGNAYGLAGWLASAALGYAIGRAFKHKLFHRFAGPRVERLLEQAAGEGGHQVDAARRGIDDLPGGADGVVPVEAVVAADVRPRARFRD